MLTNEKTKRNNIVTGFFNVLQITIIGQTSTFRLNNYHRWIND